MDVAYVTQRVDLAVVNGGSLSLTNVTVTWAPIHAAYSTGEEGQAALDELAPQSPQVVSLVLSTRVVRRPSRSIRDPEAGRDGDDERRSAAQDHRRPARRRPGLDSDGRRLPRSGRERVHDVRLVSDVASTAHDSVHVALLRPVVDGRLVSGSS